MVSKDFMLVYSCAHQLMRFELKVEYSISKTNKRVFGR